jgi:hypothetical protein
MDVMDEQNEVCQIIDQIEADPFVNIMGGPRRFPVNLIQDTAAQVLVISIKF